MRTRTNAGKPFVAFTMVELLVVIGILAVVAMMVVTLLGGSRHEARRPRCASNLTHIAKAQQAYMTTNGDFWSYQRDDRPSLTGVLNAMDEPDKAIQRNACVSLSILYDRWLDDAMIFSCPATTDRTCIVSELSRANYQWFGKMDSTKYGTEWAGVPSTMSGGYPFIRDATDAWPGQLYRSNNTAGIPGRPNAESYADYAMNAETAPGSGRPGIGLANTSYGYDDLAHWRDMKPNSARVADMRCEVSGGKTSSWIEQSSHEGGQHVLYWDGHVAFVESVYASADPLDNIYTPQNINDLSKDCVIVRTHCDALKPAILPKGANPVTPWVNW
jgi:prepilin-type processing-associated H-X9-DG protein